MGVTFWVQLHKNHFAAVEVPFSYRTLYLYSQGGAECHILAKYRKCEDKISKFNNFTSLLIIFILRSGVSICPIGFE